MRTYVLAKGLQASGKSTWALEEMRKYPDKSSGEQEGWMDRYVTIGL